MHHPFGLERGLFEMDRDSDQATLMADHIQELHTDKPKKVVAAHSAISPELDQTEELKDVVPNVMIELNDYNASPEASPVVEEPLEAEQETIIHPINESNGAITGKSML